MECEICNSEEAAFTIIPFGAGMPQSLGPACFARTGLELAKAILPAEEIADTLGPMFVKPPAPSAKKAKKVESQQPTPDPAPPTTESGDLSDDDADKDAKAKEA